MDLLIKRGLGNQNGFLGDEILIEDWFPVCSPNLLSNSSCQINENLLSDTVLLHQQSTNDWSHWLQSVGLQSQNNSDIIFNNEELLLSAAIAGQGIALARNFEVQEYLKSGELKEPFGKRLHSSFSYHLLCTHGTYECPEVKFFRDWLLTEALTLKLAV